MIEDGRWRRSPATRAVDPGVIRRAYQARRRRHQLLSDRDTLFLVAADHPARDTQRVGNTPPATRPAASTRVATVARPAATGRPTTTGRSWAPGRPIAGARSRLSRHEVTGRRPTGCGRSSGAGPSSGPSRASGASGCPAGRPRLLAALVRTARQLACGAWSRPRLKIILFVGSRGTPWPGTWGAWPWKAPPFAESAPSRSTRSATPGPASPCPAPPRLAPPRAAPPCLVWSVLLPDGPVTGSVVCWGPLALRAVPACERVTARERGRSLGRVTFSLERVLSAPRTWLMSPERGRGWRLFCGWCREEWRGVAGISGFPAVVFRNSRVRVRGVSA